MRRVEQLARRTQISKILSFFDSLPRFIHVPKPILLGSSNNSEILIEGDTTSSRVKGILANLDEPFNPHLKSQQIWGGIKREQPGNSFVHIHQQLQKGFPELCLLKGHGHCGQKIVRAHAVQKALFKNHAKNGHVYQFEPINGTRDADKRLWPDLIGIKRATTFTGFCECHDSHTFATIDNSQFQNTPEYKFLYHYRAFAQTYYDFAHKFKTIESAVKEMSKTLPATELKSLSADIETNQRDVQELQGHKSTYEQWLREKNWPAVEGYAFAGDTMPDILATGFFAPRKDLQGNVVQDCKSRGPLGWVSMTVAASNDKAVFLLCAEKGSLVLSKLVNSFRRLPAASQTTAIITYVFCHFENFILLPGWWEPLPKETQLKFVNAFEGRYYRREMPHTSDWKLKELVWGA